MKINQSERSLISESIQFALDVSSKLYDFAKVMRIFDIELPEKQSNGTPITEWTIPEELENPIKFATKIYIDTINDRYTPVPPSFKFHLSTEDANVIYKSLTDKF